jgi:hypothetical protein
MEVRTSGTSGTIGTAGTALLRKRFERSAAIERLERLEPAFVFEKPFNDGLWCELILARSYAGPTRFRRDPAVNVASVLALTVAAMLWTGAYIYGH